MLLAYTWKEALSTRSRTLHAKLNRLGHKNVNSSSRRLVAKGSTFTRSNEGKQPAKNLPASNSTLSSKKSASADVQKVHKLDFWLR